MPAWLRALCLAALLTIVPHDNVLAEEWRGLVIGIDAYREVSPLQGAINDAEDIAKTLKAAGVEDLVTLHDEQATREAILSAWQKLLERAAPEDVLFLSYAGHGAQEKEWISGSEADGLDETFLLAGFGASAPSNGERLRDDDLAAMLAAADGRTVLVLADSCHSGTMTRSIDPRIETLGSRLTGFPDLKNDHLRSGPRHQVLGNRSQANDPETLSNVIYIGATSDGLQIPELMISGKARGALSWAFARALEGRADLDKNGSIDVKELAGFLKETVRVMTEGRQIPKVEIGAAANSIAIPAAQTGFIDRETSGLRIAMAGNGQLASLAAFAGKHGDRLHVSEPQNADIIWDAERGDVLTRFGDIVLSSGGLSPEDFQAVASKWLLLKDLYLLSRGISPLEGRLHPAVGHIRETQDFEVTIASEAAGSMAVFALEADGRVRLLAPDPRADPSGRDAKITPDKNYRLPLRAAPPFGADHIVLVRSSSDLSELIGVLTAIDGQLLDPALGAHVIRLAAKSADGLGIVAAYTMAAN